jgi:hypothetical protein
MADEGAFVFDSRMAGYGAEPTPERPTDYACERRLVAEGLNRSRGRGSGQRVRFRSSTRKRQFA